MDSPEELRKFGDPMGSEGADGGRASQHSGQDLLLYILLPSPLPALVSHFD